MFYKDLLNNHHHHHQKHLPELTKHIHCIQKWAISIQQPDKIL